MREAGRLVGEVLTELAAHVAPGVSTGDLDALAETRILKAGATPAFKGYHGYPAAICASINDEVIHGIPSGRRLLREGDIVSIDVGASLDGYFGDSAITLPVGQVSEEAATLLRVTEESLYKAIERARPGGRVSDLGHAVQRHVDDGPWYTVVGVVGNVKQTSLVMSQSDAVYITTTQWRFTDRALWLVVRARGDAAALAPAIRNAIWSVDKDQPIVQVATMDNLLAASAAERRFALILFEAFGIVALVLAATGIYGVLSGSVTERTREIGVRLALGASRSHILALVFRQGMTLTGLGVVIGLSGAVAATQAIVTLLFGVSRLDPITYLGVITLLVCVSVIACWVPAWRAARVDPSITLRAE